MGALDRAIAPIPDAIGKMTMPYHTQLSAPVLITTDLARHSPGYESLAFPCDVRAAHTPTRSRHRHKCSVSVRRLSRRLLPVIAPLTLDSGGSNNFRGQSISVTCM